MLPCLKSTYHHVLYIKIFRKMSRFRLCKKWRSWNGYCHVIYQKGQNIFFETFISTTYYIPQDLWVREFQWYYFWNLKYMGICHPHQNTVYTMWQFLSCTKRDIFMQWTQNIKVHKIMILLMQRMCLSDQNS